MNTAWPVPQHFPPAAPSPYIPPAAPPGRWQWIPDWPAGCDACRYTGICMCVRPRGDVFWRTTITCDSGTVAHVGQH